MANLLLRTVLAISTLLHRTCSFSSLYGLQKASKSKAGIVCNTRNTYSCCCRMTAQFSRNSISFQQLERDDKDKSMDHSESAQVHNDLICRKAEHLNKNVTHLLYFVSSRGNSFIIQLPGIKSHNFITKQIAHEEVNK